MDSSEMEDIIREVGWTPIRRKRRNNRLYLYAARRSGAVVKERYVGAVSSIQEMSPEQFRTLLLKKSVS